MKTKSFMALMLVTMSLLIMVAPAVRADGLLASDFTRESFAKTVDFFDYARDWAASRGLSRPSDNYHAYMYMTYINTRGLKLLYAGLENITFGGPLTFTVPMQSFIMHFKTSNQSRDTILASTFLMLLAFNDTTSSLHANSPDMNDTLWASFSMGFSLSDLDVTLPVLNSKTETIPLQSSNNKQTWTWGMKYTNLTAFWWRTYVDPIGPHHDNWIAAITAYDELTFTYTLNIDPATKTATLREDHVIGRMRDLLWHPLPLVWIHYNSTGTFFAGSKISNDTVFDFIQNFQIKMSIVNFQTSITADRETRSQTTAGQNVTDTETAVGNTSIDTYAEDGEKIATADFATKQTYRLYNYTQDPTEQTYATYDANARTVRLGGYARNAGLFELQFGLLKFLPLVVYHMFPSLFAKAKDTITNMTRANYLYTVAYPNYSGYRVEHDPTLTVYLTSSTAGPFNPSGLGGLLLIAAVAAIAIVAIVVVRRRGRAKQSN